MLGGWLDQVGIRLTQLSTGLKVKAELGNFMTPNIKCHISRTLQRYETEKVLTKK